MKAIMTIGVSLCFVGFFAWLIYAITVGFLVKYEKYVKYVILIGLFGALLYAGFGIIVTGKPFEL